MVRKILMALVFLFIFTGCQTVEQGEEADISGSTWYDIDEFTNQTTLPAILRYTNESYLQNWWGTLTLLGQFVVFFVVFKRHYETKEALLASSSLCTVIAISFRILGFIPESVIFIGIVLTAGTLISTLYNRY